MDRTTLRISQQRIQCSANEPMPPWTPMLCHSATEAAASAIAAVVGAAAQHLTRPASETRDTTPGPGRLEGIGDLLPKKHLGLNRPRHLWQDAGRHTRRQLVRVPPTKFLSFQIHPNLHQSKAQLIACPLRPSATSQTPSFCSNHQNSTTARAKLAGSPAISQTSQLFCHHQISNCKVLKGPP